MPYVVVFIQRDCFTASLAAFEQSLLPSVREVMCDSFFMGEFAFDEAVSGLRDHAIRLKQSCVHK